MHLSFDRRIIINNHNMDLRNYHHVLAFALLILASGSCGKQSERVGDSGGFPADRVVRVSPEVAPQTRGSYTTENLKEFDLFIHSENSKYSYTNTGFTKNTSGEWVPARQMLWEGKDKGFKFLAVAPPLSKRDVALALTGDIFEFTVESVQTAESNASDLLLAGWGLSQYIFPSSELGKFYFNEGKLKLEFSHALSLLKVQLTLGTELNHDGVPANNPISELKISGFQPAVKVSYLGLTPSGDATEIQAYQSVWTAATDKTQNSVAIFECIVVPQKMDKFTVNFICGGKPYTYTADVKVNGKLFPFESGKAYTLPLTVGKDEVIMGSDITAKPWESGNGEGETLETD